MSRRILCVVLAAIGAAQAGEKPAGSTIADQILQDQAIAQGAKPLRLDDVVLAALSKNPAVQSATHTVSAQRAKVPQASALPDPTFGVGWMGNPRPFSVQTGDPSSYRSVSAMQMLPFPGKRSLRGQIAGKEADASQWDLEAVRSAL